MRLASNAGARPKYFPLRYPAAAANNPPEPRTIKTSSPKSGGISTVSAVAVKTISHTPSDAITIDSKINRDATSARALAALAGSCFMEERLTHRGHQNSLFSHDGIHDSQTHLAAPSYFYELLEQEIAISDRSGVAFSLIRIVFRKARLIDSQLNEAIDAADILYFSEALKDLTRKQDCVARLGINECVILVKANSSNVEILLTRLISAPHLTVENSLIILAASVEFQIGEGALTLLNRLDLASLSTLA